MKTEVLYEIYKQHPVVCTDTRKIIPGSIFFALKGESFNGNKFAMNALQEGCAYAVIDESPKQENNRLIQVRNVLKALQELGAYHRKQLQIPVIGITGSNGKTTTKELINAVLSKKYKTYATKGNLNNHIGVPLSILEINKLHEVAIIEMGANHIGEISDLCKISQPDYGIITNIGKAHLEGFGSVEGVVKAKTELYQYIKNNKGKVFLNESNSLLMEKTKDLETIGYGFGKGNISGKIIATTPFIELEVKNKYIKTNLTGAYNAENILAAICVGRYFGIEWESITSAIAGYNPTNNRSQIIKTKTNILISDAYNANPVSMEAALNNLKTMQAESKVAILGGMRELGKYEKEEHQKLIDIAHSLILSRTILVGSEFDECDIPDGFKVFKNASDAVGYLQKEPIKNSLVLVKGSRGIKLEGLMKDL